MWIHLLTLRLIDGAGGSPVVEDVRGGYWYEQWEKLHKKKPKLEEVIELVKDQPQAAIEQVKEAVRKEYPLIDYSQVASNIELQRFIASQILIVMELRRISDDDNDIETLLLLL